MEEVMAERVSLSPNLISWYNYEASVRTAQRICTYANGDGIVFVHDWYNTHEEQFLDRVDRI